MENLVVICNSTCCRAFGSDKVIDEFKSELRRRGLEGKVHLKVTGCHGFCEKDPTIIIYPSGIFYQSVKVSDMSRIIDDTILNNKVIEELLFKDSLTGQKFVYAKDVPFFSKQKRLVLNNVNNIDPTKIEDYISVGGYKALAKVLSSMSSEQLIDVIKQSGLRGRGGAGFPTGMKWEVVSKQKSDVKYLICNGDEGDPGAYMDRSILESNPHAVIEGMIIGAYATGASYGWAFIRHEYPLAVQHFSIAINQAQGLGLLGDNILGSGFNFNIKVSKGAGAFVSGEETALISSIEGRRSVPRQRPPYPAVCGLFNKPTCINNVETWANIPLIINNGAEHFNSIGTKTSKGTKIFSLVGKVQNTGLVEVPMGITLNEIVFDIGGGAPNGKEVKAVQTGGPSGGCIPKKLFNIQVDYESLKEVGSIMGSGGMIVMDENTCMVDVAKYFTNFLQDESCGKCISCREGTQRLFEILNEITEGNGKEEHIRLLKELATVVKDASLCGLGQTAANPVLSTLKYFEDEYVAHIRERKCPALVCKALIRFDIDPQKCTGCLLCKRNCPSGAIIGELKKPHSITKEQCIKCSACFDVCNFDAVVKYTG